MQPEVTACASFPHVSGGKETQHDVWKYNASLNKWIQVEYLSTGRWRHKMAVLGGKVYVMGGFDGGQRLSSVEAYDPFHNSWTEVIQNFLRRNDLESLTVTQLHAVTLSVHYRDEVKVS